MPRPEQFRGPGAGGRGRGPGSRAGGARPRGPGPGGGRGGGPSRFEDAARDHALTRLSEHAERFPDIAIAPGDETGLTPLDAAFSHAITEAALRRWLTLAYPISGFMSPRRLSDAEPKVIAALVGGAAQMYFLDRVPAHAAIDASVEWVKRRANPGAGGLVNAVLRRVSELRDGSSDERFPYRGGRDQLPRSDGSAIILTAPVLPADEVKRLSVVGSMPEPIVRRWVQTFGMEETQKLVLHGVVEAPVIVYTAHAAAPIDLPGLTPHDTHGHAVFTGAPGSLGDLMRGRSDIWVQDPASTRTVECAAHLTPNVVVDLCAGQGTKTRQLAATFPGAVIIASDPDPQRADTLRGVFRGHATVRTVHDASVADEAARAGGADLVLLDVPCSNSGVTARRLEARYRMGAESLARLVRTQRDILTRGVSMLKPGGRVIYATCSLEPEENREQTAWALSAFGLEREHEELRMPAGQPGDPETGYRDGAYTAVLKKPGG